ncbi:LysR family transcriptional regulator [Streptomyces justiciae]|uniref:LysR family transcriptional regulator n=1 Tax=Streptomyces justiciae TaxID=2780140 RepID=UPI002117BD14|nr:LysR family transcriptional regulator [Streptomyces justiciae]MCW8379767.1 LysR family transcriptional regulator [Streptomyces justiciae]
MKVDTMNSGGHLGGLDLNLLLALEALLQERNVTRAAKRLGLTQPSVSAALAKLRRHFGDELLSRVGNHYELTPLACRLADSSSAALIGVERVFGTVHGFAPAVSDRVFTLVMSDYAVTVLGEGIAKAMAEQAPGVRLVVEPPNTTTVDRAAEILRTVDGVLLPQGLFTTDVPRTELFQDAWVCVASADNPAIGDELTMEQLAELPWVNAYHRPANHTPAAQLDILGITPRAQITVGSFFAVAPLVAGTDRIALMQARLAARLAPSMNLKVPPCPFDAVPVIETMWWHPMHRDDPAHQWLRGLLSKVASSLPPARQLG